jgi:hypothetical protein
MEDTIKRPSDWTNKTCDICNSSFDYYDNRIHRIKTMSGRKGILYCPNCIKDLEE